MKPLHRTDHFKRTSLPMPANTVSWQAEQIVAYMTKVFKTRDNAEGIPAIPANKSTAFMMNVFETFADPARWKNPFFAYNPRDSKGRDCGEWLKAAIIWYHGREAVGYKTEIIGSWGYACD